MSDSGANKVDPALDVGGAMAAAAMPILSVPNPIPPDDPPPPAAATAAAVSSGQPLPPPPPLIPSVVMSASVAAAAASQCEGAPAQEVMTSSAKNTLVLDQQLQQRRQEEDDEDDEEFEDNGGAGDDFDDGEEEVILSSRQRKRPQQLDEDLQHDSYHSLSWAYQTYLRHDQAEQNHWADVCRAFRQYAVFAMEQWANHQYRIHELPEEQRRYLPPGLRRETPQFLQRSTAYKEAAIRNQFCLDCILRHAGQPHSQGAYSGQGTSHVSCGIASGQSTYQGQGNAAAGGYATDGQMSKVSSVLKSLARDWSSEGKAERDMAYQPILLAVKAHLPVKPDAVPRICVPGAGVARLACELSALGYAVQGNEFSLFMLLASDFILNGPIKSSHPLQISPWILESRNVHNPDDPLRVVRIPDVDPYDMLTQQESQPLPPDFSMAAGEFVSIYNSPKEKSAWDAVVSCFFIDASPSIVEYIQVIFEMLKPGGYFFNFGPLLWHWSGPAMRPDDKSIDEYQKRYSYLDKKYLSSVDLCWQDVRDIMVNIGFEVTEETTGSRALYTADSRSMMNMEYRCILFVARKPFHSKLPTLCSS